MEKEREEEKKPSAGVQSFANALEEWAAEGPDRKQKQQLLKWLLSCCESREFKGSCKQHGSKGSEEDKYVTKRTVIEGNRIKEAVMRAMASYNPESCTSGWIRGGPIWPKAYGDIWPKAYGYIWPKAYGQ
jgi:hypothetical protein